MGRGGEQRPLFSAFASALPFPPPVPLVPYGDLGQYLLIPLLFSDLRVEGDVTGSLWLNHDEGGHGPGRFYFGLDLRGVGEL